MHFKQSAFTEHPHVTDERRAAQKHRHKPRSLLSATVRTLLEADRPICSPTTIQLTTKDPAHPGAAVPPPKSPTARGLHQAHFTHSNGHSPWTLTLLQESNLQHPLSQLTASPPWENRSNCERTSSSQHQLNQLTNTCAQTVCLPCC